MDRRKFFNGAVATAGAGLAGCATTAAPGGTRTPFEVPAVHLPIVGSTQVFPVRRIYCIGRNYADHVREMGADPKRDPPVFFSKPADAVVANGEAVPYPPQTANLHHEIELVIALDRGGRDIPVATALDHVFGYAVGLDMTRRDLQRMMGDQKKPWEIGKSFDSSAPIGPLHTVEKVGHVGKGRISLAVNGTVKQDATLAHMIWSVEEQIAQLSMANELFPGDIIYTGTPENVGPVVVGDTILCKIEGLPDMSVKIV